MQLLAQIADVVKTQPEVRASAALVLSGCAKISVDQSVHVRVIRWLNPTRCRTKCSVALPLFLSKYYRMMIHSCLIKRYEEAFIATTLIIQVRAFATFARHTSNTQLQAFLPADRRPAVVAFLQRRVPESSEEAETDVLRQEMEGLLAKMPPRNRQAAESAPTMMELVPEEKANHVQSALTNALESLKTTWTTVEACLGIISNLIIPSSSSLQSQLHSKSAGWYAKHWSSSCND